MLNFTYAQLIQAIKPTAVHDDSNQLANELICEYAITNDCEIAELLDVSPIFSAQKAVRIWVQRNLPNLDKDDCFQERYRQLRRLFQQCVPDLM